jgi:hypothetical protein
MRRSAGLMILGLAASAAPATAHHALTGYDRAREIALSGVVVEFHFRQPHPFLVIEVEAAGARRIWRLEMDNLSELSAIGLSRDTFRAGDRVLVGGDPSRDGADALYLRRLDRPRDGLRYEQVGSTPRLSATLHPRRQPQRPAPSPAP